ncbi:MAG: hypothetical protein AAB417_01850 [Patescibacteria group bacterium]
MNNNTRNYIVALGFLLLVLVGIIFYFILRSDIGPFGGGGTGGGDGGGLPDTGGTDGGSGGGGDAIFPPKNEGGDQVTTTPPLTADEIGRLVQISKDPVVGATIRKDELLYFKRGTGHIFASSFNGLKPEERLTNFSIPNIMDASWSPSRAYTLVTALNEITVRRFWIHLTGTSTIESGLFDDKIVSPKFSPTEEKIAGIIKNGSLYTVVITTPQGKTPKTVFQTSLPNPELSWVSKTLLALQTRSTAFIPSILQTIPTTGGGASTILADVYGLDVLWDTGSNKFLTLEVKGDGKRPTLVLHDRRTPQQGKELSFKTFPEKCVWSGSATSTVYCAIPWSLGAEPVPDGWWKGKVSFDDSLWKIDINTGDASSLLEGGAFDMTQPMLSPKEDYFFFINKKDSMLWSLRLTDTATSTGSN